VATYPVTARPDDAIWDSVESSKANCVDFLTGVAVCMEKSVFVYERDFAKFFFGKGIDELLVADWSVRRIDRRSVCNVLDIYSECTLNPRTKVWKDQSAERVSLALQSDFSCICE
jgi:hypothetical protein